MRILFVCLGNICRSPIAEGVLQHLAREQGLDWTIRSAGTNRYHKGGPADPRSVAVCQENGVDISRHIARRFERADFTRYDVIYALARDVLSEIEDFSESPEEMDKVITFEVPDPWYSGEREFRECYSIVRKQCEAILQELTKKA